MKWKLSLGPRSKMRRKWYLFDGDPALSELVYFRDVVPYKHFPRGFYVQNGVPICWGAGDCLSTPRSKCAAGNLLMEGVYTHNRLGQIPCLANSEVRFHLGNEAA